MWGKIVEAGEICDFKFIYVGKILCVYSGHTMLCACVCISVKIVGLKLLLILQERKHILKLSLKNTHTQLILNCMVSLTWKDLFFIKILGKVSKAVFMSVYVICEGFVLYIWGESFFGFVFELLGNEESINSLRINVDKVLSKL